MSVRVPLLAILLLAALLLAAGAAQGSPPIPGLDQLALEEEPLEAETGEADEEGETECDSAWEEADEGVLTEAEAEQVCEDEAAEEQPATKPRGGNGEPRGGQRGKSHANRRKKACRHKSGAAKRRCLRRAGRR